MFSLEARLAVAKAVAHEAGLLARRRFIDREATAFTFKGPQDYLTQTDGEVERFVVSELSKAFPGDSFIGEEGGGQAGPATWIIDPIDGTSNFARGIPHFCVSIGFVEGTTPKAGVIYAPLQDELYAAALGQGATLNGETIRAADTTRMDQSVVEIGWNTRRPTKEYMTMTEAVFDLGGSVRRSGSGALGVVYVAAGRTDGYAENHINAWDVAAGLIIATEAGARVNDFFGGDGLKSGNPILVAAPGIAAELSTAVGIALKAEN